MKRLLLYVHFNKYNKISEHVYYQLEHMHPLFSKVIFISNSQLDEGEVGKLRQSQLIDAFIQRENIGYDFAAWHDGMAFEGFENLKAYDSVTAMNDTCFGPLWDMAPVYDKYESDEKVDFWGMTNHRAIDAGHIYIDEHLQSYFMSFKKSIVISEVFQEFWKSVEAYTDVQKVIDNYETKYTKRFVDAGFRYASVLNTVPIADNFFHSNFTIHYPHVLLDNHVPFIKIKTFDLIQHLAPYLLKEIEKVSNYPTKLILDHMSDISLPTPPYLLDRKVLKVVEKEYSNTKKSPEYPYWVGDSWRNELYQMLIQSADNVLANLENNDNLGLVIADIPSFFRYTKIVDPWNENRFADGMNELWERMNLGRQIDFNNLSTFIMSYGTFIWFKHDTLKPLFDLELTDDEIPSEPIPQHTILHSIERILVYLAWANNYDYAIAKNDIYITPFVDNVVFNIRPNTMPNTYVNFDNIGGIKGALKYIYRGPGSAIKYIVKRMVLKFKS